MASPDCAPPAFNNIGGRRSAVIRPGSRLRAGLQPSGAAAGFISDRLPQQRLAGHTRRASAHVSSWFERIGRRSGWADHSLSTTVRVLPPISALRPRCVLACRHARQKKRPARSSGFPAVGRPCAVDQPRIWERSRWRRRRRSSDRLFYRDAADGRQSSRRRGFSGHLRNCQSTLACSRLAPHHLAPRHGL